MELKVRIYGDPVLRKKAQPVDAIDDNIRRLANDMIDTMYAENGVGLAAPQVGISLRMLAMDAGETRGNPIILLNPEITHRAGECVMEEGCLSFPGIYGKIKRSECIHVRGKTIDNEMREFELEGLEARAILHEIDHLDGVLFIDRMTPDHKLILQPKLKKLLKMQKQESAALQTEP